MMIQPAMVELAVAKAALAELVAQQALEGHPRMQSGCLGSRSGTVGSRSMIAMASASDPPTPGLLAGCS